MPQPPTRFRRFVGFSVLWLGVSSQAAFGETFGPTLPTFRAYHGTYVYITARGVHDGALLY